MKQFLKLVCFVLLYCAGNNLLAQTGAGGPCPDINVSTGIDATGNAIAIGATDPFWTISSGPVGPAAKRVQSYLPHWEATPVPVTNACWINGSGTIFNNAAGNYTFSRTFNIAPGTTILPQISVSPGMMFWFQSSWFRQVPELLFHLRFRHQRLTW